MPMARCTSSPVAPGPERHHAAHAIDRFTTSSSSIPELHAGEAYMDGRMRFEDSTLRDFLTLFSINRLSLGAYPLQNVLRRISRGLSASSRPIRSARRKRTSPTTTISATTSTSSSSTRACSTPAPTSSTTSDSLEEAQQNKLRLIAAKLHLKPGLKILDIGSGWGDLALYLARLEDVDVTGVTLSQGAARALEREGAARPGSATACASSCATTATSRTASTASSRSACSSTSACSTTASSSPRSTR